MSLTPSHFRAAASRTLSAPVLEVFASVQGEGVHVGEPQVFLRLAGCPLRCRWCDTPGSWSMPEDPLARADGASDAVTPGRGARIAVAGAARREDTWATPFQAATWITEVEPGEPRTISVTGGEPLLWPEFLVELRTFAGPRRLHLETAGAHPRALERTLDAFDHVSLDLKLPRDLDAPVAPPASSPRSVDEQDAGAVDVLPHDADSWAVARRACLALLRGRDPGGACAKIVVAGGREPHEFEPLLDDVMTCAPDMTVVLQPVTPVGEVVAPESAVLLALVELALDRDLTVRVVPQVHRVLRLP